MTIHHEESDTMRTTDYLEIDDPKVLAFRFRADVEGNRSMAAELRRRADELDAAAAAGEGAETPSVERIEQIAHVLDCSSTHTDPWNRARIIRLMATTGMCHWHASWVVYGSRGEGCSCSPCRNRAASEREVARLRAAEAKAAVQ